MKKLGDFPSRALSLRDGRRAVLRRMRPEDLPAWRRMIWTCSGETLWRRFELRSHEAALSCGGRFGPEDLVLVAEIEGVLAGEVRLCPLPDEKSAEFCVLVADPWQGQGLGAALTDFALELAKEMGLEKVLVEVVPENARIIDFLRRRGFCFFPGPDGLIYCGELLLRQA